LLSNDKLQFIVENPPHNAPRILQILTDHDIGVKDLELKGPTLEDAFLKLTGTRLDEDATKNQWKALKGRRRTFKRLT
jgi:hypothetical protein